MFVAKGVSVKNTMRHFKKHGSVDVLCKNPWTHLHPRHLVKEFSQSSKIDL